MRKVQIKTFLPNIKDYYYIYDNGQVYSEVSRRFLTRNLKRGYYKVNLQMENGKQFTALIHRLLMMAFKPVENMEELQVNHIDGNKLNDNLDNLEWVTASENIKHAWRTGLAHSHKHNKKYHKLRYNDVKKIKGLLRNNIGINTIAKQYDCSPSTIYAIKIGKNWKYVK